MRNINKHRGDLEAELARIGAKAGKKPEDRKLGLHYAKLVFQSGDFEKAKEIIERIFAFGGSPLQEALWLLAEIEYLSGNYGQAEEMLLQIVDSRPRDRMQRTLAELGLVFVYYQTNRFKKAGQLVVTEKATIPHALLMNALAGSDPYRLTWNSPDPAVRIDFEADLPLPVLPVTVNGKPIHAIIDTGAEMFYLDSQVACELGIKPLITERVRFAGGKQNEQGYAIASSLRLGQAELENLPVLTLPTRRWSLSEDGAPAIGGVIGTQLLKQFLATIDYPGKRLILRKKSDSSGTGFRSSGTGQVNATLRFSLGLTHFLLVNRGVINGKKGMTFLIDSGLADASGAAFASPAQTLAYLGIPVPGLSERGLGGGIAPVRYGYFDIAELGLGDLPSIGTRGIYGAIVKENYWGWGSENGGPYGHSFIIDGILSHNYLKRFAWTIDFTNMAMTFETT